MSTSATPRIEPGTLVGAYVVERRLAQGGMGVLFLARERNGEKQVALKFVADDITAVARARMQREARALSSLDHPGIVRIHATGEHGGVPWIAMEYVQGVDLRRYLLDRGPVAPEVALSWVQRAAEALAVAHDAGVIHRDLKPSNLILSTGGIVKIVDFGVARPRFDAGSDIVTTSRDAPGTPAYLSPEQLEHGLADERSDVWALGCVLYELCVGMPPFGRGNVATTTAAILRDEPTFPQALVGPVVPIITGCLRKSSFARIGSARELIVLLRDAVESGPAEAAYERRSSSRMRRASERVSGPRQSSPAIFPSAPSERPPRPSYSNLPRVTPPSASSARSSATPPPFPPPRVPSIPLPRPPPPGRMPTRISSSRIAAVAQTPARGHIKGTAIRAALLFYASNYGPDKVARIFDFASDELKAQLRPNDPAFGLMASGWYATPVVGELLDLMQRVADPDDADAYLNLVTQAVAKDNVGGVYRSLFRLVATPKLLEQNAQRVWQTYSDDGVLVGKVPEPGQLVLEVREQQFHHPTVCRTIGVLMQNTLRLIGYTALIVERTECVEFGASSCLFEGLYLL